MARKRFLFSLRKENRQKGVPQIGIPPYFHTPSFPRLTHHQRDLINKLVEITRKRGEYLGEFWWRVDPDEPNIVTQIKPRTREGNFDPDNPIFQGKEWDSVVQQANMATLDRLGYIVISEVNEYGSNREKWRHIAVAQQGFDFYDHIHKPLLFRFAKFISEKSENHLLAFVFGLIGAIAIELIKFIINMFS